ncbi:Uncharacterised protein [Mycobacteroides abscessus subsp. bolletii]|uniref:hypothetical protein n=1 Tax=Mycobacteroides abscessus TaxID=36809 RepID=UPI0009A6AA18|nr:hypothetical protein [Mycobacteroides abscessus]SKR94574.1 Uncharacterised protein [Mycobacteroides abscessus subsp. bolletii]SKS02879.1 Uncharacterised protein [Mycobacteroides abscessus subsp. bolletii]DAZ90166.1 TPA_asm: holin [Mycobacterium phage prophiFVLQ01-1]
MPNLSEKLTSTQRIALYGVTFVVLTALAAANVIDKEAVPPLLDMAGTMLGLGVIGVAGRVLHEQRRDGLF